MESKQQTGLMETNMASTRTERMDDRMTSEEKRKRMEEAAIREAERELMEQHRMGRKIERDPPGSQVDSESESDRKKRGRTSPSVEEKRKAKARKTGGTEEDEGEETDEEEDDPLRMSKWWTQPTIVKMVTKPQTQRFEKYLVDAREALTKAREERVRLETRVEERGALVEMVRSTVREELNGKEMAEPKRQLSYVEMATRKGIPKITGVRGPVQPVPKRVIIRQENKESEEVKKTLKELVKPAEIGLKVKRMTKIRNGVILEVESEEGIERLMKDEGLQKAGVKVEKPNSKKPVVMVYDVSTALKDEEVKEEVYTRNMDQSDITEQEFRTEFEIKHRYKDKAGGKNAGNRNHLVVECSVRVRNWLRSRGKIFVEWEGCRIKDYIDVPRCYKCQRYGHVAKFCNGDKNVCPHCSGEHEIKDCRKTGKEGARCNNCVKEGRTEVKHPANWKGCPVYERAVKRYNEQIDYGI